MIFVQSGDAVLHAELIGDPEEQPVLIFANALGTDLRIWDDVAGHFAEDYCLMFYDKRGHGLSDLGQGPVTIDRHVDDLLAVADHFGIDRFGLVGLSIGGLIAQRLAVRAPERLAALVLCDTASKIGDADIWNGRIAAIEKGGIESTADATMERWFTAAYRTAEPASVRIWRNMLTRQSADGYVASCAAIRDADFTADTARIDVPTLVIVGEGDVSTPPDHVRATAERIPGAQFAVIPNCAHLPCIERPDALADLIGELLDQVTDDD
jgi:3-oxoadipate enol-lactonase